MRRLFAVVMLAGCAIWTSAAQAEVKVEVKGPHLCCAQCLRVADGLVKKVDGVSDVKSEQASKTVSFTAKDEKSAKAGIMALVDGGFYGSATADGKAVEVKVPAAPTGKADSVTVAEVHVCCGACQTAIKKLFKDAKVSFDGKGAQRTVIIEGAGLDRAEVLTALRASGFNGKIEKK